LPGLRRAPPAGARYPREGPVSRLLPRSRRRPRVVPVSSGESIITTAASTAQGPAASHFLFFCYPRRNPQRAGSYPHFTGGYPRYYSQPILSLGTASRRTPGLLPDVIGGPVHIGWRVIIRGDLIRCGTDSLAVAEDPAVRPSRSPMNHSRRPRPRAPRQRQLPARHARMSRPAQARRHRAGRARRPRGQRVLRRARCDGRWPQAPCRRRRATSGVQSG